MEEEITIAKFDTTNQSNLAYGSLVSYKPKSITTDRNRKYLYKYP